MVWSRVAVVRAAEETCVYCATGEIMVVRVGVAGATGVADEVP